MGSKSGELKEVKWSINSLKIQLDSINNHEADTDDGNYPNFYEKEGNYEKRQRSDKGNPSITHKGG